MLTQFYGGYSSITPYVTLYYNSHTSHLCRETYSQHIGNRQSLSLNSISKEIYDLHRQIILADKIGPYVRKILHLIDRAAHGAFHISLLLPILKERKVYEWRGNKRLNIFEYAIATQNISRIDILKKIDFPSFQAPIGEPNALHFALMKREFNIFHALLKEAPYSAFIHEDKFGRRIIETAVHFGYEKEAIAILDISMHSQEKCFLKLSRRALLVKKALKNKLFTVASRIISIHRSVLYNSWGRGLYSQIKYNPNYSREAKELVQGINHLSFNINAIPTYNLTLLTQQIAGHFRTIDYIRSLYPAPYEYKIYPCLSWLLKKYKEKHLPTELEHFESTLDLTSIELDKAIESIDSATLEQEIRKGDHPVFIAGGSENHSIVIVFWKNRFFIANRGSRPNLEIAKYYLLFFRCDPQNIKAKHISKLKEMTFVDSEKAFKYLYETFPMETQSTVDLQLTNNVFRFRQLSHQKNSNCIVTSAKVSLLGVTLLHSLFHKTVESYDQQSFPFLARSCFSLYKRFSEWSKMEMLYQFLTRINRYSSI